MDMKGKISVDHERLEDFYGLLPSGGKYAFEFRHASWFTSKTYQILEKNRAALGYSSNPNHLFFTN